MSRFEAAKLDHDLALRHRAIITACGAVESAIMHACSSCGRSKALALTKLEESAMWAGKMLREEQQARNSAQSAAAAKALPHG